MSDPYETATYYECTDNEEYGCTGETIWPLLLWLILHEEPPAKGEAA